MNQDRDPHQDRLTIRSRAGGCCRSRRRPALSAFLAACGTAGSRDRPSGDRAPATDARGRGTPGATAAAGTPRPRPPRRAGAAATTAPGTPVTGSLQDGHLDRLHRHRHADNVDAPVARSLHARKPASQIDYQEAVNGNEEFFASQLKGPLQAGLPPAGTSWC